MATYRKLSWTGSDVICPFYVNDDRRNATIVCEGHEDCETLTTRFKNLEHRDKFMGRYCCCTRYDACPVYKLANKKYKEEK